MNDQIRHPHTPPNTSPWLQQNHPKTLHTERFFQYQPQMPQNRPKEPEKALAGEEKRQPPIRGVMPARGEMGSCDPMGVQNLTPPVIWPLKKQKAL